MRKNGKKRGHRIHSLEDTEFALSVGVCTCVKKKSESFIPHFSCFTLLTSFSRLVNLPTDNIEATSLSIPQVFTIRSIFSPFFASRLRLCLLSLTFYFIIIGSSPSSRRSDLTCLRTISRQAASTWRPCGPLTRARTTTLSSGTMAVRNAKS